MLSLYNIKSSSHAGHYYSSGDYYIKGSPSKEFIPNEWFGKGAEQIGLKGKIHTETFKEILDGKIIDRKKNKTTYDQQLGWKDKEGKIHHACGVDMTFSAPKSISIMSEVAKDKRLAKAHIKAVKNTLAYAEKNLMFTRTKKDGVLQYKKMDNMIASLFTHDTSRELDPQLHTHCVLANAVYDKKDNKFRSAERGAIFRSKMFLGEIYKADFAKSVRELGYNIEKTKDSFEIVGVPKELMETFSKRREEIEQKLETYDYKNAKTSANVALMTRKSKQKVEAEVIYKEWDKTTQEKGVDLKSLLDNSYTNKVQVKKLSSKDINKIVNDTILHITERSSTFTKGKIIQETLKFGFSKITINEIEKEVSKLEKNNTILKGTNHQLLTTHLYTTPKIIKLEKEAISSMKQGQNSCLPILDHSEQLGLASNNKDKLTQMVIEDSLKQGVKINANFKDKNLAYNTLNQSQKQSANFILSSKDRVIGIQGFAGTGKTYMLKAVKEVAIKKNIRLEGLAPSASATKTLGESADIPARTLQSFLFKYSGVAQGRGTEQGIESIKERYKNTIFILDESSFAGTQQMRNLLAIIERIESRLVLVGDIKQLNSVEAGKPFYQLQEKGMSTSLMKKIRRQSKEHLKEAVQYSIDKKIENSFEKLKDNIIEIDTKDERGEQKDNDEIRLQIVQDTVDKYCSLSQEKRDNTLILAPANETRKEINSSIRQELIKEGKLISKSDNPLLKHINYKDINKTNKIDIVTLHNKGLTQIEKSKALFYKKNNVVLFNKTYPSLGVKKGEYYLVNGADLNKNEVELKKYINNPQKNFNFDKLNLKKNKDNTIINWNPEKVGSKRTGTIEVFEQENKELQKGDFIRWTKNDKRLGIINSNTAEITKISFSNIHMQDTKNNKEYIIPKDHNTLKHLDYGYASTVHSAQGKTSDNIIAVAESYRTNLTTQKNFYVEISRAKNDITLIVDDKKEVIKQLNLASGERKSGLEVREDVKEVNYNKMNSTLKSIASSSYKENKQQGIEMIK